ncbi:MAG: hypothetical protein ACR2Q4_07575, partial [Geminicoccaceae bacterium]
MTDFRSEGGVNAEDCGFCNGKLVLADRVTAGSVLIENGRIARIDEDGGGRTARPERLVDL